MAWTEPPRTWTTSELVTAAILNAHVRDQLIYLKAQRDLSATHIAGAPFSQHGTNPACMIYATSAQTLTTAIDTDIAFDSEFFDTDTMHDPVTNNNIITCKTAGIYMVSASLRFTANATGLRGFNIYIGVQDINVAAIRVPANTAGSAETILSSSGIVQLAANDYVAMKARQESGGNLDTVTSTGHRPYLSMVRVG